MVLTDLGLVWLCLASVGCVLGWPRLSSFYLVWIEDSIWDWLVVWTRGRV